VESQFLAFIVLQATLLGALLLAQRIRPSRGVSLFSPISWFVLFYALVFWLPQLFMPTFDYTLIGAYNDIKTGQIERVVQTQAVLSAFLVAFTAAFLATAQRPLERPEYATLRRRHVRAAAIVGLVGLLGVAALLAGLDPGRARSIIVASSAGKLLYSVSYWFTLGYMVLAAWLLRKSRYIGLLVLTALFAAALLPLGGRGRILWPLAGLLAWAGITGHARVRVWKLALAAAVLGILLQALDPLLLYLRGYDSADDAIDRFQDGLELRTFLFARNFDAFHNLAVIVGENRIATSLTYLFDNSQTVFMRAYFPSVAWSGVGYPATLPGGLWLAGHLPAVVAGGIVFGLFFAWLSRIYRRLRSELAVAVYCIAMPWLANIGTSYLESYLKMAALILPGIVLVRLLGPAAYRRQTGLSRTAS